MVIRSIIENKNKNIEIKHINNRSNSEISCSLLKYDSVHGIYPGSIETIDQNTFKDGIMLDGSSIDGCKSIDKEDIILI